MLSVPKGFFEFPLNAPTQKIIGWEVFVQSQSEHFIHVQKKVSKTRWNMHKIKKIMSLCFVNFWWNLRKWKHFFILSITKSCFKMVNCGIISYFLINLFWRIFFFKWDKEKSAKLCILEILKILSQLNGAAQDLFKLKMKKRLHFLKVHQKLTKQSDLIFLI